MKHRLILMRHAKSSWSESGLSDHQRPLNKRGQRSAPLIGQELINLGWQPQWVVSSDSQRTRETYELMNELFDAKTSEAETQVAFFTELYLGSVDDLREVLCQMTDDCHTTLALGHNPGWTHAVHWFSGESVEMTTANAALLEGEFDTWQSATRFENSWKLVDVLRPRDLE